MSTVECHPTRAVGVPRHRCSALIGASLAAAALLCLVLLLALPSSAAANEGWNWVGPPVIGLPAGAQHTPAPVLHQGRWYAAVVENGTAGTQVVVYRFDPQMSTWIRAGYVLNRDVEHAASEPTLASIGDRLYAAWTEADGNGGSAVHVARMAQERDALVRWDQVGDALAGRRHERLSAPSLTEAGGRPWIAFEQGGPLGVKTIRAAYLDRSEWHNLPTAISDPASASQQPHLVGYGGSAYVSFLTTSRVDQPETMHPAVRRLWLEGATVRVAQIDPPQPAAPGLVRGLSFARGPAGAWGGRPLLAWIDGDVLRVRRLTAAGDAFLPILDLADTPAAETAMAPVGDAPHIALTMNGRLRVLRLVRDPDDPAPVTVGPDTVLNDTEMASEPAIMDAGDGRPFVMVAHRRRQWPSSDAAGALVYRIPSVS